MSDDNKKLTVKEQKFVATLVSGNSDTAKQAVLDAGYNAKPSNAATMAKNILARPRVQNALAAAIEKRFPDIPGVGASVIYDILTNPDESSMTKLKALDYLMKLYGWQAPTKHMSMHADIGDQLALPQSEGDDDA